MVEIQKDTVLKIAKLARIRVTDEEIASQKVALSKIMSWVDQLSEVDTQNVAPLTSVHLGETPQRPDVMQDGQCVADVLSNAPEKELNMFVVPKVVE